MVKMRRGESRSFNNWLRVRVIAQGLTIVAIVAGTYSLGQRGFGVEAELNKTPVEADLERRREEKIDRDRKEFEGRLKKAEEAHRAETQASSLAANASSGVARKGWFSWANGSSSGSSDRSNDKP
jgi:Hypoxia induced protein conserved region